MLAKPVIGCCSALAVFAAYGYAALRCAGPPYMEMLLMHMYPNDRQVALNGCGAAQGAFSDAQVPLRETGSPYQRKAQQVYGIEAVLRALRIHQNDAEVMGKCISGIGGLLLFNSPGGRHAGQLGAVDLLLSLFRKWQDTPEVLLVGSLGACFDFVPENRRRFAELGGVEQMKQLLEKHYWHQDAAKEIWYGFSSGTYDNEERCDAAGMIDLGVKIMDERAGAFRIREEVLQAFKPIAATSVKLRKRLVEAGAAEQYVRTLKENMTDPQVTSLVCENMALLVGGDVQIWSVRGKEAVPPLLEEHREKMTELGALPALLEAIKLEGNMKLRHLAHGYNVMTDCIQALSALADSHKENLEFLLEAEAHTMIASIVSERARDVQQPRIVENGCKLLGHLASVSIDKVKPVYPWNCPRRLE